VDDAPSPDDTLRLLKLTLGARTAHRLRATNLRDLGRVQVSELVATYGLTEPAAQRTVALFELARRHQTEPLRRGQHFRTSQEVFRHYGPLMRDLRVEQFRVLMLDGKHRVLREELVSQGTLTSSPVHPREVFGPALRHGAAALVLVHNHPSGDAAPSSDDLDVTRRLSEVGELVGVRVLDHVIVGDGCFASLADRGLL
jgi:DNA repair protein RadC